MANAFSAKARAKKLDDLEKKALNIKPKLPSNSSTVPASPTRPLPGPDQGAVEARKAAIEAQRQADLRAIAEMNAKKRSGK
jgi:hypothetical protein